MLSWVSFIFTEHIKHPLLSPLPYDCRILQFCFCSLPLPILSSEVLSVYCVVGLFLSLRHLTFIIFLDILEVGYFEVWDKFVFLYRGPSFVSLGFRRHYNSWGHSSNICSTWSIQTTHRVGFFCYKIMESITDSFVAWLFGGNFYYICTHARTHTQCVSASLKECKFEGVSKFTLRLRA